MNSLDAANIESRVLYHVPRTRFARVLARLLVTIFVMLVIALVYTPWQQTAIGKGRVIAYAPVERQQTIDAPIDGRVAKWYVQEGSVVKSGDSIVDLADNDPQIIQSLEAERDAVKARIDAAKTRIAAIDARILSMKSSQTSAVVAADQRVKMGSERQRAASRAVEASQATLKAAKLNHSRQLALFEQGLTSKRAVEVAEAEEVRARTDLDRAEASLSAARGEVGALSADVGKVDNDAFASINDATAARAAADSEVASGNAELARMNVRIARQQTQHIKATADGTILRVVGRQGGEMVKAGEVLALFVPTTNDRAVELLIDGNDVNLVHKGLPVRIQFEGWPAVQFSGWPSLAVGTYGGVVSFVDAADDGQGRFRAVVSPDAGAPWPRPDLLRQGTRVSGWVLLGRVSVGYELWRQFNGFPAEWTGGPKDVGSGEKKKK